MLRMSLVLVSLIGIAAAVASGAFGQRTATTSTLNATVGPGFTITLKQNGKAVKSLKAGSYTFAVSDKSTFHSFALDGPHGFAKDFTTVPFKGTKTVTLKLKAGKYKFYCSAHESTMFGHFSVT
jgi:plastocyanin